MGIPLLIVGDHDPEPLQSVLDHPVTVTVSARPERAELNAALDRLADVDRLAVAADDSGLGAVLARMLRRATSDLDVPIALLPVPGPSVVRTRLGLPGELAAAAAVAISGRPVRQGLARDDHGGLTLGSAQLLPISGQTIGMRSYVDEHELVNGAVGGLTVIPLPDRLSAQVLIDRRFRRPGRRELAGRAVTVSCQEATLVVDGVTHQYPKDRCTWWFEPDRWQVIMPAESS